jgi:hypothetical protein
MHVAGEAYQQEHLRRFRDQAEQRTILPAWLVPEPENEFDRHAVRVEIAGVKAGYMPREEAGDWQEILRSVEQTTGCRVACRATLFLTKDVELILHLPGTPPKSLPRAGTPQQPVYQVSKPTRPSCLVVAIFIVLAGIGGLLLLVVVLALVGRATSEQPGSSSPPSKPTTKQAPAKQPPTSAPSGGIFKAR